MSDKGQLMSGEKCNMLCVKSLVLYLVSLLGHDDFQVRELSSLGIQLCHLYTDTVPYLPRTHTDPEVYKRLVDLRIVCKPYPSTAGDLTRYQWELWYGKNVSVYYTFYPGGEGKSLHTDGYRIRDFTWEARPGGRVEVMYEGLHVMYYNLRSDPDKKMAASPSILFRGKKLSRIP